MATLADAYEIVARLPGTRAEPHYDDYKAVLARIEAFIPAELEELIIDAWRPAGGPGGV